MVTENSNPSVVKISYPHKWIPTVIASHSGVKYTFGLPVSFYKGYSIVCDKRVILNNVKNGFDIAEDFIHTFNMPFLLLIDTSELSSNSGAEELLFNTNKISGYKNNGSLEYHGIFKFKREQIFPRGFRPPRKAFDNIPSDRPTIAWTVEEGIDWLWELEKIDVGEVTIYLPIEKELEFKQLQGHLSFTPVELEVGEVEDEYITNLPNVFKDCIGLNCSPKVLLPMFKYGKPRFFNHQPKRPIYWLPLPFVYHQPSWLVVVFDEEVSITSNDHLPATLKPGAYILTHPKPQPQSQDGARVD